MSHSAISSGATGQVSHSSKGADMSGQQMPGRVFTPPVNNPFLQLNTGFGNHDVRHHQGDLD